MAQDLGERLLGEIWEFLQRFDGAEDISSGQVVAALSTVMIDVAEDMGLSLNQVLDMVSLAWDAEPAALH